MADECREKPGPVILPSSNVQANRLLSELEYRCGRETLVSVPWQWHLSMADACNMRCIMCRVSQNPGEFELHLPDRVNDNIDALLPLTGICHVYGAEPFFKFRSSGLKRLLEAAECNHELSFVTTTNGLLVDREVAEHVLRRFSRIRFSVDSPSPETYESIRVNSKFRIVRKNIEYLRDLKTAHGRDPIDAPTIHINYLIMDRTFRDIVQFIDLAHSWGVREVRFSPLRVNFDSSLAREDIFRDIEKIRECSELISEAKVRAEKLGIAVIDRTARPTIEAFRGFDGVVTGTQKRRKKKEPKTGLPVCSAPWESLWMNREGTVRFCRSGAKLGNVRKSSLLDLYNNKIAQRIRREFVSGNYSTCNMKACPRGVSNLGTNRGDSPERAEEELVELESLDIFQDIRLGEAAALRRR